MKDRIDSTSHLRRSFTHKCTARHVTVTFQSKMCVRFCFLYSFTPECPSTFRSTESLFVEYYNCTF
ncbi:hypothetical protein DPMN_051524 [Dreissena polymorpha]|uniref:Uncharacterized protein n=1 Tax=Dreissena polymorpha TaxID=45954 RepID=A0A9D4CJX9_DREPO|nr:hypothetical protein DPMN_051524 [Dreissena polymorpha]